MKKKALLTAALALATPVVNVALAAADATTGIDYAAVGTSVSGQMTTIAGAGAAVLAVSIAIGVGFRWAKRLLKG